MASLPGTEIAAFQQQRDATNLSFDTQKIGLSDQLGRLDIDQPIAERRFGEQWRDARQQLPGHFAGRGLLNSGFQTQGLQDYARDRGNAFQDMNMQFLRRRGDVNSSLQQVEASRAIQLANIDLSAAARRSAIAAMIGSAS